MNDSRVLVAAGVLTMSSLSASADPPSSIPVFGEAEVVDAPVFAVSPNGSTPLVQFEGDWYVAYTKNDEIWIRVRTPSGWLSPERMTDDPAASHSPQLAASASTLYLVWEDDRDGFAEVWAKERTGGVWSVAACLSCGGVPSVRPALAAHTDISEERALVAWKELAPSGPVAARIHDGGVWLARSDVSDPVEGIFSPTVANHFVVNNFGVMWPETDIDGHRTLSYRRWDDFNGWSAIAYGLGEAEARSPSLFGDCLCSDLVSYIVKARYERDLEFETEIYSVPGDPLTLFGDGIDSVVPHINGYLFVDNSFDLGASRTRTLSAWTTFDGVESHHIVTDRESFSLETETLSTAGLDQVVLGASGINWPDDLSAEFLVAYVEDVVGTPTLFVRHAEEVGCQLVFPDGPDALLIAPEGYPNPFAALDVCDGEVHGGLGGELHVDQELVEDLVWHEEVPPLDNVFVDVVLGPASWSERGGGCSEAGEARFTLSNGQRLVYGGIKSPDVDGSCLVDGDDRDYVTDLLGGDDFCADLDGSGVVDAADVAIVDATMGDFCDPVTVSVGTAGNALTPLRARPNPTSAGTRIAVSTEAGDRVELTVFDVGGRVVRTFPVVASRGGVYDVPWDLRSNEGRRVPPGVYFARVNVGGAVHHLRLTLIR